LQGSTDLQAAAEVRREIADAVRCFDIFHVKGICWRVLRDQHRGVRIGDVVYQHAIAPFGAYVGVVTISPNAGVVLVSGEGICLRTQGDVNSLGVGRRQKADHQQWQDRQFEKLTQRVSPDQWN